MAKDVLRAIFYNWVRSLTVGVGRYFGIAGRYGHRSGATHIWKLLGADAYIHVFRNQYCISTTQTILQMICALFLLRTRATKTSNKNSINSTHIQNSVVFDLNEEFPSHSVTAPNLFSRLPFQYFLCTIHW